MDSTLLRCSRQGFLVLSMMMTPTNSSVKMLPLHPRQRRGERSGRTAVWWLPIKSRQDPGQ